MILVLSWRAKIQNDGNSIVLLLPQTHVNELEFLFFLSIVSTKKERDDKIWIGKREDNINKKYI